MMYPLTYYTVKQDDAHGFYACVWTPARRTHGKPPITIRPFTDFEEAQNEALIYIGLHDAQYAEPSDFDALVAESAARP